MWIDMIKALAAVATVAIIWWVLSAVITPMWDSLHPIVESYDNDFATSALGTLDLLRSVWGGLPLLLIGIAVLWVYLRAQKREPDTYYVPPGGYG